MGFAAMGFKIGGIKKGATRIKKSTQGLTLIELAVVLGLLAILSGTVFLSLRGNVARDLQNTSYVLQADLRYAQRRAIITGNRHGVIFEVQNNRYHVVQDVPRLVLRTVYLNQGVRFLETSGVQLMFLPRGTASAGFRITLASGGYSQQLTATVSGGRIRIFDVIPM